MLNIAIDEVCKHPATTLHDDRGRGERSEGLVVEYNNAFLLKYCYLIAFMKIFHVGKHKPAVKA